MQLSAAGTEGYFMDEEHVRYNPGAGAMCEGEDWTSYTKLDNLDVNTVHMYDRQMELVPPLWGPCDKTCYFNFFTQYLRPHIALSKASKKPLIIEEFNVLSTIYSDEERSAFFQMVSDQLVLSHATGGPLAGAMFWNAAIGYMSDDGYNVYLDIDMPPESGSQGETRKRSLKGSAETEEESKNASSGPPRQEVRQNNEGLNAFRRGNERSICADAAAKWWIPVWSEDAGHDIAHLIERTKGKSVPQVILETSKTFLAARAPPFGSIGTRQRGTRNLPGLAGGYEPGRQTARHYDPCSACVNVTGEFPASLRPLTSIRNVGSHQPGASYARKKGHTDRAAGICSLETRCPGVSNERDIGMLSSNLLACNVRDRPDGGLVHLKEGVPPLALEQCSELANWLYTNANVTAAAPVAGLNPFSCVVSPSESAGTSTMSVCATGDYTANSWLQGVMVFQISRSVALHLGYNDLCNIFVVSESSCSSRPFQWGTMCQGSEAPAAATPAMLQPQICNNLASFMYLDSGITGWTPVSTLAPFTCSSPPSTDTTTQTSKMTICANGDDALDWLEGWYENPVTETVVDYLGYRGNQLGFTASGQCSVELTAFSSCSDIPYVGNPCSGMKSPISALESPSPITSFPSVVEDPPITMTSPPVMAEDPPTTMTSPPVMAEDPPTTMTSPPTMAEDPPTVAGDSSAVMSPPSASPGISCQACIVVKVTLSETSRAMDPPSICDSLASYVYLDSMMVGLAPVSGLEPFKCTEPPVTTDIISTLTVCADGTAVRSDTWLEGTTGKEYNEAVALYLGYPTLDNVTVDASTECVLVLSPAMPPLAASLSPPEEAPVEFSPPMKSPEKLSPPVIATVQSPPPMVTSCETCIEVSVTLDGLLGHRGLTAKDCSDMAFYLSTDIGITRFAPVAGLTKFVCTKVPKIDVGDAKLTNVMTICAVGPPTPAAVWFAGVTPKLTQLAAFLGFSCDIHVKSSACGESSAPVGSMCISTAADFPRICYPGNTRANGGTGSYLASVPFAVSGLNAAGGPNSLAINISHSSAGCLSTPPMKGSDPASCCGMGLDRVEFVVNDGCRNAIKDLTVNGVRMSAIYETATYYSKPAMLPAGYPPLSDSYSVVRLTGLGDVTSLVEIKMELRGVCSTAETFLPEGRFWYVVRNDANNCCGTGAFLP
eukprot:gene26185-11911_t